MKKKLFSALLALCMVLSLLPTAALAADGEGTKTARIGGVVFKEIGNPDGNNAAHVLGGKLQNVTDMSQVKGTPPVNDSEDDTMYVGLLGTGTEAGYTLVVTRPKGDDDGEAVVIDNEVVVMWATNKITGGSIMYFTLNENSHGSTTDVPYQAGVYTVRLYSGETAKPAKSDSAALPTGTLIGTETIELVDVTFDANGGKWGSDTTSKLVHAYAGDSIEAVSATVNSEIDKDYVPALYAEAPTRDGKVFKGWATTQNAETPDAPAEIPSCTDSGSAVTYYAVWGDAGITAFDFAWKSADANTKAGEALGKTITNCLDQTVWFKVDKPEGGYYFEITNQAGTVLFSSEGEKFDSEGGYASFTHGGQLEASAFLNPNGGDKLTLKIWTAADKSDAVQKTITIDLYNAPVLSVTAKGEGETSETAVVSASGTETLKGQYFVAIYGEDETIPLAYAVTETDAGVDGNAALPVELTAEGENFKEGTYTVKVYACPHDVGAAAPTAPAEGAPVLMTASMTGGATVEKTEPSVSPDSETATVAVEASTTITVTTDGTVTAASSDPDKVSVTVADGSAANTKIVTITGVAETEADESVTVTIRATQGAAYAALAEKAIAVTVTAKVTPPPSSSGGNNSSTTPSTPSTPSTTDKETTVNVTPTVKDDTVSATVSDRTANQLVNEAVKNESETVVVKVETPKNTDATEAQVSLPASAVAGLAEKTDASLTVDTSVAAVTIDNAALADLGKDAESVTVTATVSAEEETGNQTVTIAVAKDGEAVSDLGGALKADVPVASLSEQEDATLTVDMPTVNVTLDSAAVADLSKDAETITVGATVTNDAETGEKLVNITVGKDGKASEQIDGSLKVTIPVEEAAPGSVAILVNADGTETIIKKSSVVDGSLDVVLNGSATLKIVDNSKDFDDTEGHWAKDSIDFVSSRELFQGTSANTFDADMTMNRAMLVTVLHRLENTPAGGKVEFPDVTEDTWYTEAVAWGASNGIVTGTGAGFNPDGAVTREQIATFLYRYAKAVNANTELTASFENFTDGGEVSSWAAEAMAWAIGAGIIQGTDGNALNPSGEATRGEVSTMLMRLIEFLH